ncbi:MAG: nucleotidyltransferase domain-containing protein [Clostridia bacterium]|nr:nucleotidyltransferase domain-containing protein [Clostridia bacterium]
MLHENEVCPIIYTLNEIKSKSIPIAQKYDVRQLGLFGSYARGEQTESSDLDFLISKGRIRGLLDYMGFALDMEDAFGCHVEVVTDGINDIDFLEGIKNDEVLLYEAE